MTRRVIQWAARTVTVLAIVLGSVWLVQRWHTVQVDGQTKRAAATARAQVSLAAGRADTAITEARRQRARQRYRAERALTESRRRLIAAIQQWDTEPDHVLRRAFISLVGAGRTASANTLLGQWQPAPDDPAARLSHIRLLLLQEQLDAARELAWAGAERFAPERSDFMRAWYDSFLAEPGFWSAQVITLDGDMGYDRIRPLNVATSVLLRFDRDRRTRSVLKPMQTNPFTSYRGEVAAYRLCPLIHCDFSIPHNAEVRISATDLADLMGLPDVADVDDIHRHDSRLVLFEEGDTRWLYGTLKEWVPGFTNFPIEAIDSWRHLVDGSLSARELRRLRLAEALPALARDTDWWPELVARQSGATPFELAHQLSDMHVFDLLINNWDRYSSSAPGSNCQWNHGQFVSIDNGASFQTPEEWRGHDVELRVRRVRRFSRRTVQAVRWMDTEAIFPILFPENAFIDGEHERYRYFLHRRDFLLAYLDELIAAEGEDAVLIFP